ncbi:MAG: glycosyltransferase [Candidatus Omnitrophica bacterium]|nr:glycosyltransferase [Candidatus Omnitrophota bacterium]
MIHISVGVCAYQEGENVQVFLASLWAQRLGKVCIDEVIIIWDGHEEAQAHVLEMIKGTNVKLVISPERQGKFVAINQFLEMAAADVLVMVSADLILGPDSIECLCQPFLDGRVGMTGGRPIPKNSALTFFGYMAHLQWQLHHALSLDTPKFGELVAFRMVVGRIAPTLVDEEEVAAVIQGKGYVLRYVPDAVVYNKGVETLKDFFRQRRRVYAGHLDLKKRQGYRAATINGFVVLRYLLKDIGVYAKKPLWLFAAVALEAWVRMLGWMDFILNKNSYAWPMAKSTKSLHE